MMNTGGIYGKYRVSLCFMYALLSEFFTDSIHDKICLNVATRERLFRYSIC